MPDLILSGALQYVDFVYIELHTNNSAFKDEDWRRKSAYLESILRDWSLIFLKPTFAFIDDEQYRDSNFPLPGC